MSSGQYLRVLLSQVPPPVASPQLWLLNGGDEIRFNHLQSAQGRPAQVWVARQKWNLGQRQLEDALRDKNKGLHVPQNILDLEYKHNKEFRGYGREEEAGSRRGRPEGQQVQVHRREHKSKRRTYRQQEAPSQGGGQSNGNSGETPAPSKPPGRPPERRKNIGWMWMWNRTKPCTKQTAKRTVQPADPPSWMEDVKPPPADIPNPRTKQTARKTTHPVDASGWMDIDVKPPPADMPKAGHKAARAKDDAANFPGIVLCRAGFLNRARFLNSGDWQRKGF
ncbi:hypothetical protein B0H14DRAFT_3663254 [Mycena olivaceomarginata]|nr:hypothetical protein B0H14DRAFT_3663254 [Mycena olivaceomarginata]